jgi:hypothetical protein
METYEVKILQMRRRLGIKEVTALSIHDAEAFITQLLKQHFNLEAVSEKVVYLNRSARERKLKLQISDYHFSISLVKSTLIFKGVTSKSKFNFKGLINGKTYPFLIRYPKF